MKYYIAVFAAFVAFIGCAWGLGELRGADAQIRRDSAGAAIAHMEVIKEIAENEECPAIVDLSKKITTELNDQYERAEVALNDHGFVPSPAITPGSPEADQAFNEYAGLTRARDSRRRTIKPGAMAKRVAGVVGSMLPWWVRLALWGTALYAAITTILAVRTWLIAKAHRAEVEEKNRAIDEYDMAIERLPETQRRAIGKGRHLEKEHFTRNLKRKIQLEEFVGKVFPGFEEDRGKTLALIGDDVRHKEERLTDGGIPAAGEGDADDGRHTGDQARCEGMSGDADGHSDAPEGDDGGAAG